MKAPRRSSQHTILTDSRGQIVLEYVLLLVIGLTVAIIITSTMVSRNPERPGFLVSKWLQIIQTIGNDTPDDLNPTN